MRVRLLTSALFFASLTVSVRALADDVLHPGATQTDRPTPTALGVQWLVSGDDDFDARVNVRYRVAGSSTWRDALPLFRVHPEVVTGMTVAAQFAGSVFDLAPATMYEIELHAVDPDGTVDQTVMVTAATRPVPSANPMHPRAVAVSDAAGLRTALNAAQPGDVITLANGTYAGEFSLNASGTTSDPIVIRGASRDGVVLDGGNTGGNVLEIYGSDVHLEQLTIQHDNRGLRFQGGGATRNVVRRVRIRDVILGIGARQGQSDFYLCDNVLEGRLAWPAVYADDGGTHANDDGINVQGSGHVVCHNSIVGFGDAMKIEEDGARAVDFYGNEVLSAYDNGLELDATTGNARALRNRFTNTYATLSFQPIYGGPAYAIRNVVVNVAHEQMKLHSLGGTRETSGIFVLHNTFVSANYAQTLEDSTTAHYVTIANNLFVGPAAPMNGRVANWDAPIEFTTVRIDRNGWYPDGQFHFGYGATGMNYANFAGVVAGGRYEAHGVLLGTPIFAAPMVGPADYHTALAAADVTLADMSNAIDRGETLPNIDDGFQGAAPDLGALERGCAAPIYGPRPDGVDESNEPLGCMPGVMPGSDAGTGVDASAADGASGADVMSDRDANVTRDGATTDAGTTDGRAGCGCRTEGASGTRSRAWMMVGGLVVAATLRRRRRMPARG